MAEAWGLRGGQGGQGQAEALHPPQVLTAQQLPKLNAEKPSSIVDPLVRVEIYGVPMDCARKETDYVLNNGGWACWWRWVGRQQRAGRCRAEASWLRPPCLCPRLQPPLGADPAVPAAGSRAGAGPVCGRRL